MYFVSGLMKMEIEQMIEDRIREGIDHEKAKKKIEFWTVRNEEIYNLGIKTIIRYHYLRLHEL